ncbi:MAG: hypothetical protein GY801_51555 [bacterium]|nr:hypothetical protein [bacterium]
MYYDQTAPGVGNWKKLHFPSLKSSQAFLLVCTPGIAKDFSKFRQPDWVYKELRWWRRWRNTAPIVIDTTGEGKRWLPDVVTGRWPDINRIALSSSALDDDPTLSRVRDRIIDAIRESEQSTVFEDLERSKRQTRRLTFALIASLLFLCGAGFSAYLAYRAWKSEALAQEESRAAFSIASSVLSSSDPTMALLLAERAASKAVSPTTSLSLAKAFNSGSWFYSHRFPDARDADLSPDGKLVAWISSERILHIHELESGETSDIQVKGSKVGFVPSGNLVVWSGWSGAGTVGHLDLLNPEGIEVANHEFEFFFVTICPDGTVLVPSFSGDRESRQMVLHVIDSTSGSTRSIELPSRFGSLDLKCACLQNSETFVVANDRTAAIVGFKGEARSIDAPNGYLVKDLTVHDETHRVALYLSGAVRGVNDALGVIESDRNDSELDIIGLPPSPSFDSGGIVEFMPNGDVLAASTEGWTNLVDIDTRNYREFASRSRATDIIGISPHGDLVILGRRSGRATVYTPGGIPLGLLLGESLSDGFERLVFDEAATMVLSVPRVRGEAILWRRPHYGLVIPHTDEFDIFDDVPENVLKQLRKFGPSSIEQSVEACQRIDKFRVDDMGRIGLCVQIGDRTSTITLDYHEGDMAIIGSRDLDNLGYQLIGQKFDRIFLLDAGMILSFVQKEDNLGRIWDLEPAEIERWVGPDK